MFNHMDFDNYHYIDINNDKTCFFHFLFSLLLGILVMSSVYFISQQLFE